MKKNFIKRILHIFVSNLLIFILLYIFLVIPIKKSYNYSSINATILPYTMETDIVSINHLLKYAKINELLNEEIVFNNEVNIVSHINERHSRPTLSINIYGKYKNYSPNTTYSYNESIFLAKYNHTTVAYITYYANGTFELDFQIRLSNTYLKDATRFISEIDPFVEYYLENNNIVRDNIKTRIQNNYIAIIGIIVTIDLIFYYILYFFKQKNK